MCVLLYYRWWCHCCCYSSSVHVANNTASPSSVLARSSAVATGYREQNQDTHHHRPYVRSVKPDLEQRPHIYTSTLARHTRARGSYSCNYHHPRPMDENKHTSTMQNSTPEPASHGMDSMVVTLPSVSSELIVRMKDWRCNKGGNPTRVESDKHDPRAGSGVMNESMKSERQRAAPSYCHASKGSTHSPLRRLLITARERRFSELDTE